MLFVIRKNILSRKKDYLILSNNNRSKLAHFFVGNQIYKTGVYSISILTKKALTLHGSDPNLTPMVGVLGNEIRCPNKYLMLHFQSLSCRCI